MERRLTTNPIELGTGLYKRRATNRQRGLDTAWANANEFISLKKGYPFMLAGIGGVGKTEFILDLMINASIQHGWKWLILSPEMGDKYEVTEQIIEKISHGQVLERGHDNSMSDELFNRCLEWVGMYFRILDPMDNWKENFGGEALNIKNFFEAVGIEEKRLGGSFDGIVIDPFNELDIELGGGKTMSVVKNELDMLIAWTKKRNYFTILTNHVNDKQEIREKIEGEWCLWTPPAKKSEWAYGQQFDRKGYQMVLIYEMHTLKMQEAANCGDAEAMHGCANYGNMREFYVQKTKPKGVGKTGKFRLFYDPKLKRTYSIDKVTGVKRGILWPFQI